MAELRTEAGLLLDVLIQRLAALRPATTDGHDDGQGRSAGSAAEPCAQCGHDPQQLSCSGCPVCALLAVLRGERPELTAKLLDNAVAALTGLRALLPEAGSDAAGSDAAGSDEPQPVSDKHSADDHSTPGSGEPQDAAAPSAQSASRSERIDIT